MNKKLILLVAVYCLGLLSPLVTRADLAIIELKEPAKNAVDCLSINLNPVINDITIVAEVVDVSKTVQRTVYELAVHDKCYPIDPEPDPNYFHTDTAGWPPGQYLMELHVFWNKYLPENFVVNLATANKVWQANIEKDRFGNGAKYYLGTLLNRSDFRGGLSWELIKIDSVIKRAEEKIAIDSLAPNSEHSVIDINVKTNVRYDVWLKDGFKKEMDANEFNTLAKVNAPAYDTLSHGCFNCPASALSIIWPILKIVGLLLLSFIIEALVFYWFGSRRIRNFLWLLLANLISYPIAIFSVLGLVNYLEQFEAFPDNDFIVVSIVWLVVESLVMLIEFSIVWFGLRRHYPAKQIGLFVFVANLVTALIGLAISYFMLLS